MYTTEHTTRICEMNALLARFDEFPPGCDPDFDTDFGELEREFAELRMTFNHD